MVSFGHGPKRPKLLAYSLFFPLCLKIKCRNCLWTGRLKIRRTNWMNQMDQTSWMNRNHGLDALSEWTHRTSHQNDQGDHDSEWTIDTLSGNDISGKSTRRSLQQQKQKITIRQRTYLQDTALQEQEILQFQGKPPVLQL